MSDIIFFIFDYNRLNNFIRSEIEDKKIIKFQLNKIFFNSYQ